MHVSGTLVYLHHQIMGGCHSWLNLRQELGTQLQGDDDLGITQGVTVVCQAGDYTAEKLGEVFCLGLDKCLL